MKRLLLLLTAALPVCAQSKDIIPLEDFFSPPVISRLEISPDGKHVSGLAPSGKDGRFAVRILDLEKKKSKTIRYQSGFDVNWHRWVDEETILLNVSKNNTYTAGLFRLSTKGLSIDKIIGQDAYARIIHRLPKERDHIRIWIPDTSEDQSYFAKLKTKGSPVSHSALKRGQFPNITQNPLIKEIEDLPKGEIFGCITDHEGELRLILQYENKQLRYLHREDSNGNWSPIELNPEEFRIVNFHEDSQLLLVVGYNGENTEGLYVYDPSSNQIGDLIYRDERYDIDETARYLFHKDNLIGLTYHRERPTSVWFVPQIQRIQDTLDKARSGRTNVIFDWSDDFKKLLVYSYSDSSPTEYMLLDLERMQLDDLASAYPNLRGRTLPKTDVMKFETSDGLLLEGYLTQPLQGVAPYPMIVIPHGGPWARDKGGFDPETQFLANRGYAVLRVNYRGSSGFGKIISKDHAFRFRDMNDDITQAVKLVVKNGIADRSRLAIMGASFGGYAAISGAAFEPDLYQCAITNVGVFDWEMLIKSRRHQNREYTYDKLVQELGKPGADKESFDRISPIKHVANIKIPIFIAHGIDDNNVSVKQSRTLERELRNQGANPTTFYRNWEGHGFADKKNRIELYSQIEAFLKANL